MKTLRLILIIALLSPIASIAQKGGNRDEIKAMRAEFITREIKLTPEQAETFWPVLYAHDDKLKAIRKEMKAMRPDKPVEDLSDEEALALIDKRIEIDEKRLNIDKEFIAELKKILNPQQIIGLHHAEEKFKKELLRKLKGQNRGEHPPRR